jgi:predicted NUDIX family phosphoesterase/dephospho-CoA kinase
MSIFLQVAMLVLSEIGEGSPSNIYEEGRRKGYFGDCVKGKTPEQTLKSKICMDILKKGEDSRFIRTKPNIFALRATGKNRYHAPRYSPKLPRENVLAITASKLKPISRIQGFSSDSKRLLTFLDQNERNIISVPRLVIENDNTYKQIIVYVIVTKNEKVLCYRRGTFSTIASFLKGNLCIGFGGHLSELDRTIFSREDFGLCRCAARELSEEIKDLPVCDQERLARREGFSILGFINDDSSSVGECHMAVVCNYEVSDDPYWEKPKRGEKGMAEIHWISPLAPINSISGFEYWSQLCLRALYPNLVSDQAAFIIRRKWAKPPRILVINGKIGSGKSEVAKIIKDKFNFEVISTGRVLAQILGVPPVPETPRSEFQDLANNFITQPDSFRKFANELSGFALSEPAKRLLFDGIRQVATFSELKKALKPERIFLVHVHAPPDLAYRFYRQREDKKITHKKFLHLLRSPVESELDSFSESADAVIYNWVGIKELEGAVKRMAEALGIRWKI